MVTVTDLLFEEEFGHLRQVAESRGWGITRIDENGFLLTLPARDRTCFALRVTCDGYPGLPPNWSWYNTKTCAINQPTDTPKGHNGYFHPSGRICAPWNRSAYKQEDMNGPHDDWTLQNWATNPKTGQCTTLTAMALRIFFELFSENYQGRMVEQ